MECQPGCWFEFGDDVAVESDVSAIGTEQSEWSCDGGTDRFVESLALVSWGE